MFVRGFIRSYAKTVGLAETTPLGLFDRAIGVREEAARAEAASPVVDPVLAGIVPGSAPGTIPDHLEEEGPDESAASGSRCS